MSNLSSNLLGRCPLVRKNCPYRDSYCSDCIKYETEQKRKGSSEDVFTRKEELSKEESEWLIDFITKEATDNDTNNTRTEDL